MWLLCLSLCSKMKICAPRKPRGLLFLYLYSKRNWLICLGSKGCVKLLLKQWFCNAGYKKSFTSRENKNERKEGWSTRFCLGAEILHHNTKWPFFLFMIFLQVLDIFYGSSETQRELSFDSGFGYSFLHINVIISWWVCNVRFCSFIEKMHPILVGTHLMRIRNKVFQPAFLLRFFCCMVLLIVFHTDISLQDFSASHLFAL